MMQAKNIHLTLGDKAVLQGVNFSIKPGELVVLLGANGAGKSSLLQIMAGSSEHRFRADEISYDGQSNLSVKQLASRRAVLSQLNAVPFELRVEQIVEMGLYPFDLLAPEAYSRLTLEAMELAGVSALSERQFMSLSGGEQQRAQFARTLVQVLAQLHLRPEQGAYWFLDEPLNSLDPQHQQGLLRVVKQLCQRYPLGVMMILHDINWAAYYADRIALLHQGRILADTTPQQALSAENIQTVFGMRAQVYPHPLKQEKIWIIWQDE